MKFLDACPADVLACPWPQARREGLMGSSHVRGIFAVGLARWFATAAAIVPTVWTATAFADAPSDPSELAPTPASTPLRARRSQALDRRSSTCGARSPRGGSTLRSMPPRTAGSDPRSRGTCRGESRSPSPDRPLRSDRHRHLRRCDRRSRRRHPGSCNSSHCRSRQGRSWSFLRQSARRSERAARPSRHPCGRRASPKSHHVGSLRRRRARGDAARSCGRAHASTPQTLRFGQ